MKTTLLVALSLLAVALLAGGLWLWTPDKPRAELEAKYLRAPSDLVDILGVRLHLRESGPAGAPAVILLHGFGSSLHTWEPWAVALAVDRRVLRFDMPGTGLSGPDPTGDYSDPRSLALLAAIMDRAGLASATLIGNSMGARIAWKFAAASPERVEKLVLISPDGFASPGISYGKREDVPLFVSAMRYVLPKALLRMNLAPAYGDPARLADEVVTRYHDLMLAPGSRDALIARMKQLELTPPEPLLRRITAPVLLVWGDRDRMIPLSNAADYGAALPRSRLVVLPGLGHVPHEEAPAVALAPVEAFLAE